MIAAFVTRLGPLRAMLAALLLVLVVMAPSAMEPVDGSIWSVLASMIAPALVPIVLLLVLFDAFMARVIMSAEDRRERYGSVLWTYVILSAALILAWSPFYARLF